MSIIKGIQAVAAFKKASTWGTPVLLGAGDGIGIVSESMKADVQLIEDRQLEGSSQQRTGEAGNRMFSGDIVTGDPSTLRTAAVHSAVDGATGDADGVTWMGACPCWAVASWGRSARIPRRATASERSGWMRMKAFRFGTMSP